MGNDDGMSYIYKETEEVSPNGHTLNRKKLTIQGKDIKEVDKLFNKHWKDE